MIEEDPPEYTAPVRLTDEERRQAFKEWAEEKKHVYPGEDGTLPAGIGGVAFVPAQSRRTSSAQPNVQLPPPSYATVVGESSGSNKQKEAGPVRRWLDKRQERKDERRMSQGQALRD
nr:hypothetical protein CFP56_65514 [Quercus suber]